MGGPRDDIDLERGGVRIGYRTAVATIVALVGVTVGGVTTWAQVATQSELELQRQAFEARAAALEARTAEALERSKENALLLSERDKVAGKLDFLIEAQIEQARTNVKTKRAVEKAMERVRARAKAKQKPDPIADLVL